MLEISAQTLTTEHPPSSLDGDNCQVLSCLMVPINLYARGLQMESETPILKTEPPKGLVGNISYIIAYAFL